MLSEILDDAVTKEIETFQKNVQLYKYGVMHPDDFRRFRLQNGVYGIRGQTDVQMIRVKIRYGALNSNQLRCLADVAGTYTPGKIGHITTRQDMQFHFIALDNCAKILKTLADVAMTTREACGNTVRNVTCCPYAGVSKDEVFDVTPYADVVSAYFLRNPINQNLPRKFKFAFEGCPVDHAATPIHDIGAVAALRNVNGETVRGFKLYVGGGLGAVPHVAELLEEFTPADLLIPTCEAVLRVFDRYGERKDKLHARLKFLIRSIGFDDFVKRVIEERRAVISTGAGDRKWTIDLRPDELPPEHIRTTNDGQKEQSPARPGFERWKQTNTLPQKQSGYYVVSVNCPLGDISDAKMRELAGIADTYAGGFLRTTIEQNFVLRWVREKDLTAIYNDLVDAQLATPGAGRMQDITRCPGSDSCQLAVTRSRGLASALLELFNNGLKDKADTSDVHIKISGCTNSCGQHHVATIGFYGTYRKVGDKEVPCYQLLLGGSTKEGAAHFGQPVIVIPARRVPACVEKLVELYNDEKKDGEKFEDVMTRIGREKIKALLEPVAHMPAYSPGSKDFYDWAEDKPFVSQIGQGECAA